MEKVKFEDLEVNDILFTELDYDDTPLNRYLVIKKEYDYIILHNLYYSSYSESKSNMLIITKESDYFKDNLFYKEGNLINILDNSSNKETKKVYCWMGIEYNNIKLLVNLSDCVVEKYDYKIGEWIYYDTGCCYDENKNILEIIVNDVNFKIDLNKLGVKILTPHQLKYKNFYNYLLAEEGDYVFNFDNELDLIRGDE